MEPCRQTFFAGKLRDLERQYQSMQQSIRDCGRQSHPQIRQALQQAKQAYRAQHNVLQARAAGSRSRAVRELAALQLKNSRALERLLESGSLAHMLHTEESSRDEDRAEAAALYAEYAMDYAAQAVQYAQIAALHAIDLQLRLAEQQAEPQPADTPDG